MDFFFVLPSLIPGGPIPIVDHADITADLARALGPIVDDLVVVGPTVEITAAGAIATPLCPIAAGILEIV